MTLERIERLALVRGPVGAAADRAERAGDDHTSDAVLQGRAQPVAGAEQVVGENLPLAAGRGRELRRTMVDAGDARDRGNEGGRITQIAEYAFHVEAIDAGIVAVWPQQDPHGSAVREQPPQQVGAEMSIRPGEQDQSSSPISVRLPSAAFNAGGGTSANFAAKNFWESRFGSQSVGRFSIGRGIVRNNNDSSDARPRPRARTRTAG